MAPPGPYAKGRKSCRRELRQPLTFQDVDDAHPGMNTGAWRPAAYLPWGSPRFPGSVMCSIGPIGQVAQRILARLFRLDFGPDRCPSQSVSRLDTVMTVDAHRSPRGFCQPGALGRRDALA